ncbi:formyltransferase family protein [Methylomonas sp. MO1]|uniref:formyltransferase family protein n=1 Tax=unclassified Methylomonas TaxID=2608980 RepID=UPI00047B4173|nr:MULTISPECIES: formyltransferase family protein [unclassified Methylomonas]MDT4291373.1 formyltransferase family protein [Methylomonas sp. MO1]
MINIVIISSTNGGVLSNLLENTYFRERIRHVVSDRRCGAIEIAKNFGIPTKVFESKSASKFSNSLLEEYKSNQPDLYISFYTKLFKGEFLSASRNRLINLHPSILPACRGLDGFGDTIKSGSKFIGATIHFVNEGIDTGYPLIQSATPFNPEKSIAENRHRIFIQQCKMLLQVLRWWEENRIQFSDEGYPKIINCSYHVGEFSPNLDFDEAMKFDAIMPNTLAQTT